MVGISVGIHLDRRAGISLNVEQMIIYCAIGGIFGAYLWMILDLWLKVPYTDIAPYVAAVTASIYFGIAGYAGKRAQA